MKRLTLLLATLAAASVAMATTYVRVEKDGSKTYSDRPLPGGQPVDLEPAQTYKAQPQNATSSNSNLPAEQRLLRGIDDFTYESCRISPENDATFTNPASVSINVSTTPGIRPGDSVNLVVDGKAAEPGSTQFILQPADRGTHTVTVTLRDSYGRVLCSASSSFHVMRPSLNMPGRR